MSEEVVSSCNDARFNRATHGKLNQIIFKIMWSYLLNIIFISKFVQFPARRAVIFCARMMKRPHFLELLQ